MSEYIKITWQKLAIILILVISPSNKKARK